MKLIDDGTVKNLEIMIKNRDLEIQRLNMINTIQPSTVKNVLEALKIAEAHIEEDGHHSKEAVLQLINNAIDELEPQPKVRCNNCMRVWHDEDDLPQIVLIREGKEDEIIKGCPDCGTDACLMDLV
jgi:hypothetical protein